MSSDVLLTFRRSDGGQPVKDAISSASAPRSSCAVWKTSPSRRLYAKSIVVSWIISSWFAHNHLIELYETPLQKYVSYTLVCVRMCGGTRLLWIRHIYLKHHAFGDARGNQPRRGNPRWWLSLIQIWVRTLFNMRAPSGINEILILQPRCSWVTRLKVGTLNARQQVIFLTITALRVVRQNDNYCLTLESLYRGINVLIH